METRKKSNRVEPMTHLLKECLFGEMTVAAQGPRSKSFAAFAANLQDYKSKWKSVDYIDSETAALLILKKKWETATASEAEEAFKVLESERRVRRIGQKWKILRPEPNPNANPNVTFTPWWRGNGKGSKEKPGECPRCGFHVANRNRHNNKLHTNEECHMNIVKKIMVE
jgi:hypothetical protein